MVYSFQNKTRLEYPHWKKKKKIASKGLDTDVFYHLIPKKSIHAK